jgi:glutamine synthetase
MEIDGDLSVPDLAARARADGVSSRPALPVDLNGEGCASVVPVEAAEAVETDEAGFAAGAIGRRPGDPDLVAVPVTGSSTPLPSVPGA